MNQQSSPLLDENYFLYDLDQSMGMLPVPDKAMIKDENEMQPENVDELIEEYEDAYERLMTIGQEIIEACSYRATYGIVL